MSNNNIPRRVRKFYAGNYGKPDECEKKVNLPNPLFPEQPKVHSKKKQKKDRKICEMDLCPFCGAKFPFPWWTEYRNLHTCSCGAYEVPNCPCCHHKTWYNPKTQVYKHQYMGCGFEGKKKVE